MESPRFDAMGVVNHPVEDAIGHGRIADLFEPEDKPTAAT
jgi:hypothetical protein